MECNGEITQYQVTQIDTESGQMQEFEVEGSDTSLDLGVKKVRQYLIKLKARTLVGYSEHYTSLVIPAYQDKLPPPTNILVEAEGSVLYISWGPPELSQNSPEERILGYTLYYCTGSKFTYKCEDPVQWLHLPNNQTSFQWTVPGGDLDNKMIGISVEMETSRQKVSSGLLWNQCVYRQKDLLPPHNVRFSRKQPDNGLQVDWDKFVCAEDPVYVSHFVLSYCVTNSQAECADPPLQVNVSNKDVSHIIQGLSAGVKYRVTLRAVSRTGEGPDSDPIIKKVTKAAGYMWVVVLVVVLVLVLMVLVFCVCYWKVRKVTKKGFYLPVEMPEFPPSQITASIGQHECNPNAVVEDNNNNSTKRDVCVFPETVFLSHMEHQDQSSTSGSRAKSHMKLHREEGSSSDASAKLSSTGNKSVETYSKVDLPSVCTNADNMSACLSNQDCLISGQNYSPEMEVQLGFMFASSPFPFHVLKTQSPTLPTLPPTLHPQSLKPHNQPPTPYIQPHTPKTQSPSPPGLSPTPHSQPTTPYIQPPTPPTHSPTPNIQSATPHTLSPTPNAKPPTPYPQSPTPHTPLSTPNTQSPTPHAQPPTPHAQSPTPHTPLSTPNIQSPTPQPPTSHPQSPTHPALSPTPHSQPPTPYIQPPTPHAQPPTPHPQSSTPYTPSSTPHTPSSPTPKAQPPTPHSQPPTPHSQSPTPYQPSSTPHTPSSPTPKAQPPTPHPQSPTPHTPLPTFNTQSPTLPTQSNTRNSFTTDPFSLAHLPTGPSTQPQTPPTVTRAYLSNPFVPPSHSQAPHNVITHQLSNPFQPFTSPTQSQATTAIATCLPPSCPPATPLPSCTPTQAPCAGYVSHEEALNLCQAKNHHE
ncbi:proteoglycan 4-like [Haliotis rubra]|uniref:proteoglycan 4-like n=1 Tax=Haliotis rubra TaxID=36100 RepID=UPI001EE54416|nr:proteoglycan 4-like [Haliotis rubra]